VSPHSSTTCRTDCTDAGCCAAATNSSSACSVSLRNTTLERSVVTLLPLANCTSHTTCCCVARRTPPPLCARSGSTNTPTRSTGKSATASKPSSLNEMRCVASALCTSPATRARTASSSSTNSAVDAPSLSVRFSAASSIAVAAAGDDDSDARSESAPLFASAVSLNTTSTPQKLRST
jgi:hypothetical protein